MSKLGRIINKQGYGLDRKWTMETWHLSFCFMFVMQYCFSDLKTVENIVSRG